MIFHSPSTLRQWPGASQPSLRDDGKTVHQPERRGRIAAVIHESEPFGIADEIARDADRANERAMRRLFVVEMKAVVGVANAMNAFLQFEPFLAITVRSRKRPRRIIGRRNRVLRKGMQDVGEHQFLVLLLVIEPDLHQRRQLAERVFARALEEFHHRRIDVAAIGGDFVGRGPGQMAALVAGVPGAGADIIGIEEIGVVGMKRRIIRTMLAEQELLEEPGGMGAVPFRRAGIRHRLDQLVLGRQGGGAPLGLVPDGQIGINQPLG